MNHVIQQQKKHFSRRSWIWALELTRVRGALWDQQCTKQSNKVTTTIKWTHQACHVRVCRLRTVQRPPADRVKWWLKSSPQVQSQERVSFWTDRLSIIHIKASSMLEAGAKRGSQRNTEPKEKQLCTQMGGGHRPWQKSYQLGVTKMTAVHRPPTVCLVWHSPWQDPLYYHYSN